MRKGKVGSNIQEWKEPIWSRDCMKSSDCFFLKKQVWNMLLYVPCQIQLHYLLERIKDNLWSKTLLWPFPSMLRIILFYFSKPRKVFYFDESLYFQNCRRNWIQRLFDIFKILIRFEINIVRLQSPITVFLDIKFSCELGTNLKKL